jgi:hypothetical protein
MSTLEIPGKATANRHWCGMRMLVSVSVATTLLTGVLGATGAPASASTAPSTYDMYAFTSQVSVNNTVTSDATFPDGIGCTTVSGLTRTNGGAVDVPGLVSIGASTNTTTTSGSGGVQTGVASDQSTDLSIMAGLVSANGLTTSTTATSAADGTITDAGSLSATNLTVGLTTLNGTVAPDTVISLPGVGSLTLNKQIEVPGGAGLVTIAVDLNITSGINAGTEIQIGYTHSFFRAPESTIITGAAYSNLLSAGPLSIGPLVIAAVPCLGGTATQTLPSVVLPGVLTTGAVSETATAAVDADAGSGTTTSTASNVNLLDGLVTAGAVTAQANVAVSGGTTTVDDTGTDVTGLAIGGVPYSGATAPNTVVPLPGVGALVINRQIVTATSIQVIALEIVVFVPQVVPSGTLPFGTDIQAGIASISASSTGLGSSAVARDTVTGRGLGSLISECATRLNHMRCLGV